MKRKFNSAKFDAKTIIDVAGASLIVQQLPTLLSKWLPIPASYTTLVGAGSGFLIGSMFKRPLIANASIALAIVEMIAPTIGNTMTVITGSGTTALPGSTGVPDVKALSPITTVDDYISLNDYITDPSVRQTVFDYENKY